MGGNTLAAGQAAWLLFGGFFVCGLTTNGLIGVHMIAMCSDQGLPETRAATLLGVPANRVPMVMSQVSKLLNVEGYPVVATEASTQAVTLDASLLAEQYGVRA